MIDLNPEACCDAHKAGRPAASPCEDTPEVFFQSAVAQALYEGGFRSHAVDVETQARDHFDPVSPGALCVDLVFGLWRARSRYSITGIGGDMGTWEAIAAAVDEVFEDLPDNEGDRVARLALTNPDGTIIHCIDDEDLGVDWLRGLLISADVSLVREDEEEA